MRDIDVREAVRGWLHRLHEGDDDTLIVEEMGVWAGAVRIDIAVINGELSGFELKSDRDTLERLPYQAEIYGRVFDKIDLVVGSKHATKSKNIIPEWWGVTVATANGGEISLTRERDGSCNPSLDPYVLANFLWKEEAISVLDSFGLAKGWRSKSATAIHNRLATELPLEILRDSVRNILKNREDWLSRQEMTR